MKKFRTGTTFTAIMILAVFLAFAAPAQATLIGDKIEAAGSWLVPTSNSVIGAGKEFTGINGSLYFDFAESTLTITTTSASVEWSGFGTYVFSDFDDVITGLSIASNDGFFGTISTNYSFTDHSITLDMYQGRAFADDAVLVFNIGTGNNPNPVPEPSTMLLLGLGLAGVICAGRKFRK